MNRTLQELKRDGVVAVQARNVRILDWPRLARIGDFDPAYLHLKPAA